MSSWTFRFGAVLDPDDPVAIWVATLALAFNDLVHTNVKTIEATAEWERFYEWRVAVGHLNEACLHLERGGEVREVKTFLESDRELKSQYDNVMQQYANLRAVANRFRNEAAFHYPYKSGLAAVSRALKELEDEEGEISAGGTNRLRDSRLLFADDIVSHLVWNAAGGRSEDFEQVAAEFAETVQSFMRFANAALDAYLFRRKDALERQA